LRFSRSSRRWFLKAWAEAASTISTGMAAKVAALLD
jgi:hypothetical protein